jgi:hypothetical protein
MTNIKSPARKSRRALADRRNMDVENAKARRKTIARSRQRAQPVAGRRAQSPETVVPAAQASHITADSAHAG